MPVKSYTLGPGTLKLGVAGVDDFSCQVRKAVITPTAQVETDPALDMLCGERLEGQDSVTYDWALDLTFLQDIEAGGIVAYTWTNAGTEVPFEFIPSTAKARKVTGDVRVDPIALGGEAKQRPTSDATWKITSGAPVLANV